MLHIEKFIQLIVPLVFLAIYALTSILNRDTQPLPPRSGGRPPGPGGPRPPVGRVPSRPLETRTEGPPRWSGSTEGSRTAPGGFPRERERAADLQDEEILLIRSEGPGSVRTTSGRPSGGSPPSRRPSRTRPPSAPGPKRTETPAKRMQQPPRTPSPFAASLVEPGAQPTPLAPLALEKLAPIKPVSLTTASTPLASARALLSGGDIRALMASPQRLREAFLANELLGPPLALRPEPAPPVEPRPPLAPGSSSATAVPPV